MPMVPELPIAMLACARIGAPHSVVFGGFAPESLRDRINDCKAKVVITADGGYRRGGIVPLKKNTDDGAQGVPAGPHRHRATSAPARRSAGSRAATSGGTTS